MEKGVAPATTTLRPRRLPLLGLLAVALAFTAAGVGMTGDRPLAGWFVAGFFGLCAVVFAVQLIPNSTYLRLEPAGFTFASMFRAHFVPWDGVQQFSLTQVGTQRMVGWTFTPSYAAHATGRRVSRALSGLEAGLPDTYGLTAEALVELLERHRQAALAR